MQRVGDLEGKVAVVTGVGASEGIGFATARLLAEAGARVVVVSRTEAAVLECAQMLVDEGHDVVGRKLDISSEEDVSSFYAFIKEQYGRLDVLDNNAARHGHQADGLAADLSVALWDDLMATNARGTMIMCKHAIPLMIASGGGSIVNISSGTALAGDFFATAYAASKGAVNTFTRYVATQYGHQGIRCNALSVGLVMTGALKAGMPPPLLEVFRQHNVTKTLGEPVDIAEMVVFLASERSRYISGQIIPVDGGIYAHIPSTVEVHRILSGE